MYRRCRAACARFPFVVAWYWRPASSSDFRRAASLQIELQYRWPRSQ
jgi:hypothetical protein